MNRTERILEQGQALVRAIEAYPSHDPAPPRHTECVLPLVEGPRGPDCGTQPR